MAEGWLKHLGGDRFEVFSAGIEAHGKNPRAISVMREAGVDISDQESNMLDSTLLGSLDLLVTVCGHADEFCPVVPASCKKEHWPFDDPAKSTGTEEEIMDRRDEISVRLDQEIDRILDVRFEECNRLLQMWEEASLAY